jgi:hypothetical protein
MDALRAQCDQVDAALLLDPQNEELLKLRQDILVS